MRSYSQNRTRLLKDIMTATRESIKPRSSSKQITVRWPDKFWERVAIAATRTRTSMQALVTQAVEERLVVIDRELAAGEQTAEVA
jgi:predicted HicB family RNase H-like nuclease